MSASGQPEKRSRRAYIFWNVPDSCQKRAMPAFTFSATSCQHVQSYFLTTPPPSIELPPLMAPLQRNHFFFASPTHR